MRLITSPTEGLHGELKVPASKSHTLRAVIFASLAEGHSTIFDPLDSPDAKACARACEMLGANIQKHEDRWEIEGTAGKLMTPNETIDVGNSGIALRFITGVASNCDSEARITGDASLCRRPMQTMLDALEELGVKTSSSRGFAPLTIKGPLKGGSATVNGRDSQHISGLLIGCMMASEDSELRVKDPGEKPWIDMTMHWFSKLGIRCRNMRYQRYRMPGNQSIRGFDMHIPADFSSAAFPIAAALITPDSELTIKGLDMDDCQGDKKIIDALRSMGADISITGDKMLVRSSKLQGREIDVNDFIDAVPILSVVGCHAEGTTILRNAGIARTKESDRLSVMEDQLKKMGARIAQTADGLIIKKSKLKGVKLDSHMDHRIAMSLAVAGMVAEGETIVEDAGCIAKTFGSFKDKMKEAGARIR